MSVADRLLLEVANRRGLGADLTEAIEGVDRSGTLELEQAFPSLTVTVDDPRDRLMESSVLVRPAVRELGTAEAFALRPIDLLLDGVWYRLRQASRSGDGVALKFNHRGAVYMAQHDSPMSASRADVTRAQAIRRQVLEAGRKRGAGHRLAFWAYELRRRMPIAAASESTSSRSEPDRDVGDTLSDADTLKHVEVGGQALDAGQRKNAALVFAQANADEAPPKALLALAEACIVEPAGYHDPNTGKTSGPFDNPGGGDASSVGILQLLSMHGSVSDRRDVKRVVHLFLTKGFTGRGGAIELARKTPGATAGEIAGMVQGPRADLIHRYNDVKRDAERVVAAFGNTSAATERSTYTKPFRFRRPRGENGWTNTGKLADEVKRRRFVTIPQRGSDLFAYGADVDLLRLRAQATIDLDAGYVSNAAEYDLDYGKTVRAMRLTVAGDPFDADFAWGLPVIVQGGPAGRWLVFSVHEVDGTQAVELELRQPQAAALEPRSDTVTRADTSDTASGADDSATGKFVARGKSISEQNLPYVWGGGHAHVGRPDRGTGRDPGTGYDCSGYISACAHSAGMWPEGRTSGMGSGELASSWGEPGEGERLTVWANDGHTFAEVKIPGERVKYVDTSRQAGGGSGPHVRYGQRSTAGFVPRHWPGT